MSIATGKVQYESKSSSIDFKTYIESLGSDNRTIKIKGELTADSSFTIPSNIEITVSKRGNLIIGDGVTITFDGPVNSNNLEWISCYTNYPPIFNDKSSISTSEFIGSDNDKLSTAVNSAILSGIKDLYIDSLTIDSDHTISAPLNIYIKKLITIDGTAILTIENGSDWGGVHIFNITSTGKVKINGIDFFRPEWIGVKCDATDETNLFSKTIECMRLGGNTLLKLGAKKYIGKWNILGNDSISISGIKGSTILEAANDNEWAMYIADSFVPNPNIFITLENLIFEGNSRKINGLMFNVGSGVMLNNITFYKCKIGVLNNSTIVGKLDTCFIRGCDIGIIFTVLVGSGKEITNVYDGISEYNNSISIPGAFFPQYAGEFLISRCSIDGCRVPFYIDQPDNPYMKDADLLFLKCVIQNNETGVILWDIGDALSHSVKFDKTWFENNTSGGDIIFNGHTITASSLYQNGGRTKITGTGLERLSLNNEAICDIDDCNFYEVSEIEKDATSTLLGRNVSGDKPASGLLPAILESGFATGKNREFAFYVKPHTSKSYDGSVDGSTLASWSLFSGENMPQYGNTPIRVTVSDGILDTKECEEVTYTAGSGVSINFTSIANEYIVFIGAMKAMDSNFDLDCIPDGNGAYTSSFNISLETTHWKHICITGKSSEGGIGKVIMKVPNGDPSRKWRMSAMQVASFSTLGEALTFISSNQFRLI